MRARRSAAEPNRTGDQLVVTPNSTGSAGSLEHLISLSHQPQDCGVDLIVLDQGMDTSTVVGRMFFQTLGAIGEFSACPDVRTDP